MNQPAQPVRTEPVIAKKTGGEKQIAEPGETTKRGGDKWLALLLVALLFVVIACLWYAISTQPTRILDRAIGCLEREEFDQLNLELTKLEGLPEYDLHRSVLRGAMFVKQKRYGDAEELLEYLPADQRLKSIGLMHDGIARFHQQRLEEAISDFQRCLEIEPQNQAAREWLAKSREQLREPGRVLARAEQAAKLGDWKSFEEIRESLRDREDARPFYHFMTGLMKLNQRDLPQAIESFNQSQEEPTLREQSLLNMAGAYSSLGMFTEAELKYLQALEVNDACIPAHTMLAAWYHDQGAMDFAAAHLHKLAELQPDNPRPNRLLGLSAWETRQYKPAIENYREALRRPNLAPHVRDQVLVELADCLVHENDYEAALQALNDAALNDISEDSLKVQREVLLADCYAAEANTTVAWEHLERALAITDTDLNALIAKGDLLQLDGKLDEAIEVFAKAVKFHPKDYAAQFKLSKAYFQNADRESAKKHADLAEAIQNLNEKMTELNQQAAAEPNNSNVRYQLGLVALDLGKPKLASFWLESAITIDPNNLLARGALAKLKSAPPPDKQPEKVQSDSSQTDKNSDKDKETNTKQEQE